jgi:hypothetical protein
MPPGSLYNSARAIEEISPGNYLMIGHLTSKINNKNCTQLCIAGLDVNGAVQWEKRYGSDSVIYIQNDYAGKSVIKYKGYFYYAGVIGEKGEQNGIFIKIDQNGDTLWQRKFREANWTTGIHMVAPSIDGGFLITGFAEPYTGSIGGCPLLLIKTDANGNQLWKKKFNKSGHNVQFGECLVQDSITKNIYIGGNMCASDVDTIYGQVLITDSLGIKKRQIQLGEVGGTIGDITQLTDGKILAVGWNYTPVMSGAYNKSYSYFIKFEPNTTDSIWSMNFDTLDVANWNGCLVRNADGSCIVGGGIDRYYKSPNEYDGLVRFLYLRNDGSISRKHYHSYANPYISPVKNSNAIKHFCKTSDGGLIAAIEIRNYKEKCPFFVVKYDSLGCDSTIEFCKNPMSIGEDVQLEKVNIYPQPTSDFLNIDLGVLQKDHITFQIYNSLGIFLQRFPSQNEITTLDLRDFPPDLYILVVMKDREVVSIAKFLKE